MENQPIQEEPEEQKEVNVVPEQELPL